MVRMAPKRVMGGGGGGDPLYLSIRWSVSMRALRRCVALLYMVKMFSNDDLPLVVPSLFHTHPTTYLFFFRCARARHSPTKHCMIALALARTHPSLPSPHPPLSPPVAPDVVPGETPEEAAARRAKRAAAFVAPAHPLAGTPLASLAGFLVSLPRPSSSCLPHPTSTFPSPALCSAATPPLSSPSPLPRCGRSFTALSFHRFSSPIKLNSFSNPSSPRSPFRPALPASSTACSSPAPLPTASAALAAPVLAYLPLLHIADSPAALSQLAPLLVHLARASPGAPVTALPALPALAVVRTSDLPTHGGALLLNQACARRLLSLITLRESDCFLTPTHTCSSALSPFLPLLAASAC